MSFQTGQRGVFKLGAKQKQGGFYGRVVVAVVGPAQNKKRLSFEVPLCAIVSPVSVHGHVADGAVTWFLVVTTQVHSQGRGLRREIKKNIFIVIEVQKAKKSCSFTKASPLNCFLSLQMFRKTFDMVSTLLCFQPTEMAVWSAAAKTLKGNTLRRVNDQLLEEERCNLVINFSH